VSGATADVAWNSGRQTLFSVGYHASYTYNQRYSSLNGFDHTVAIELRTDPARRTVFSLTATGQSGVFSDVLFAASHSLTVAQQASSAQQLASGLLDNGARCVYHQFGTRRDRLGQPQPSRFLLVVSPAGTYALKVSDGTESHSFPD
jgi:hypothetical protein